MSKTDAEPQDSKPSAALRQAGAKATAKAKEGLEQGIKQATRTSRKVIAATKEKGEAVISTAREKGEAVIDDTREKSMRAAAETNRLFQEHPIAAVAAAAAAGAIVGIFLPRLAITSRVGKIAGNAIKAAATSEASQRLWSSVRDAKDKTGKD